MPLVFLRDAGNMPVHECPACTRTVRGCVILCVEVPCERGTFFQRKGETAVHAGAGGSTSTPTLRHSFHMPHWTHASNELLPRAILSGRVPRGSRDSTAHHSQRELAAIGMEASHALSDVKMLRSVDQRQTGSSSCRRGQMWSPRHADRTLINGARNAVQNEA